LLAKYIVVFNKSLACSGKLYLAVTKETH
jgi:hypothetical protein